MLGSTGKGQQVRQNLWVVCLQLFQKERGQLFSLNTWDAALGDPGTWNSTCAPGEALALEPSIPSGAHRSREHALAGQESSRHAFLCSVYLVRGTGRAEDFQTGLFLSHVSQGQSLYLNLAI